MLDRQNRAGFYVIGVHADYRPPLHAIEAIGHAECVFGSPRHRDILDQQGIAYDHWQNWESPLSLSLDRLKQALQAQKTVAVVASGDPMQYGIGAILSKKFSGIPIISWPAPSSFTLAANILLWPLADCLCLSLHQPSSDSIIDYLDAPKRLLCLTKGAQTPIEVAAILCKQGFPDCRLTILADLASPQQHVTSLTALECQQQQPTFSPLHILALDYRQFASKTPAISLFDEDAQFIHDGQITKFPFRALTLAALQPRKNALLWDVGAGSGSISIGWNKLGGRSLSVENNPQRVAYIRQNAQNILGKPLDICSLDAYGALPQLQSLPDNTPQAIFFGGALKAIPEYMPAMASGGTLVANAVTLDSQSFLIDLQQQVGGHLSRLHVEEFAPINNRPALHPLRSLLQYRWQKS